MLQAMKCRDGNAGHHLIIMQEAICQVLLFQTYLYTRMRNSTGEMVIFIPC